jgi:hypothetical protein
MTVLLIKHCFERAAVSIGRDLDEEDFHLAELGMIQFVNSLGQTESAGTTEDNGEGLAIRLQAGAKRPRLGKLENKISGRCGDNEVLVQTSGEFFTADFVELQHSKEV